MPSVYLFHSFFQTVNIVTPHIPLWISQRFLMSKRRRLTRRHFEHTRFSKKNRLPQQRLIFVSAVLYQPAHRISWNHCLFTSVKHHQLVNGYSATLSHTWSLLIIFAEINDPAVAEKHILTSIIFASFIIQAFYNIPSILPLLNKSSHSVFTISNLFKISYTLASLTLSAQHITHQFLTHIKEASHESFIISLFSQINFQVIKYNIKNLFIYNFNVTYVTSVLSPFSLLKHSSSVNKSPENLFITFFNLFLIFNFSDLPGPAHSLNSAIFFTFTEQENCDLHSHI